MFPKNPKDEKMKVAIFATVFLFLTAGCAELKGSRRLEGNYQIPETEASWIRDGRGMEFEGQMWYPQDTLEILQDKEVYLVGEYRGSQIFVEKADVRPYNRLYTKFGKNTFRLFEQRQQ
jgi:hypothetical protein